MPPTSAAQTSTLNVAITANLVPVRSTEGIVERYMDEHSADARDDQICKGEYQMNKFRSLLMISGLSLLMPAAGIAQSVDEISELSPEDRRAYMQSMSEEERQAKRAEWRAQMEAMPEAERNAMREKMAANRPQRGGRDREAMRQRWESMSDEERAAAKAERHQKKAERRAAWESMSDEERAAVKAQRQERKAQHRQTWESMSDEERAAARAKFGKKKGHHKAGGRQPQGDNAE
jgi:predicted Fe-S protein YdhL (DUF1289 family)